MQFLFDLRRLRPSPAEWRWVAATLFMMVFYVCFLFGTRMISHSIYAQFQEKLIERMRDKVYTLGSTLNFCRGCNGWVESLRLSGWSHPENWGTWTEGKEAILVLQLPVALPRKLILAVRARAIKEKLPQVVSVFVNAKNVGQWQFDSQDEEVKCVAVLQQTALRGGVTYISFQVHHPLAPSSKRPSKGERSRDDRLLGMGLVQMEMRAGDSAAPSSLKCE